MNKLLLLFLFLENINKFYAQILIADCNGHYFESSSGSDSLKLHLKFKSLTVTRAVNGGSAALDVSWTIYTPTTGLVPSQYNITYKVCYRPIYANCFACLRNNLETHTTISPLRTSTLYYIFIQGLAAGANGRIEHFWSRTKMERTYKDPGPPVGVTVVAPLYRGKLVVKWSPPEVDVELPITRYQVLYRESHSKGKFTSKIVSGSLLSIYHLKTGTTYSLLVAAETVLGIGRYSPIVNITTIKDAEAPANVSVSPIPYRGKLMVQWTPPEVDKGLSISWYIVEYKEVLPDSSGNFSSQLVKANTDFITVVGLKTGFTYSVRVAAITKLGIGTYSGLVYGRTFRDSPSPSNVSVHPSPQHGVLNVTWVAPQVDPGLILIKYSVKYSKSVLNEFSEQVAPGSSTSLSISDLQLGVVYSVKVAAVTPLGVGDYSILFNAKTFNVPMQVTGVHYYLERNSNVRVSWDSPKSETDLDIIQYQVQCLADGKLRIDRRTNITHFEFLFENMNGENTVFRVRAVSVIGSGEWSTPLSITLIGSQVSDSSLPKTIWSTVTIFPVAVIVFSVIVVTAISCHRRRRRSSSARSMFIDETEEQDILIEQNSRYELGCGVPQPTECREFENNSTATIQLLMQRLPHLTVYAAEDVTRFDKLGRGSFWKVYEGKLLRSSCAIKRLRNRTDRAKEVSLLENVLEECATWSSFTHPHVIQLYGIFYEQGQIIPSLVVELMDKSLTSHLNNTANNSGAKRLFSLSDKISVLMQVVEGLHYLHNDKRVVHGDLTANNILLKENSLGSFTAKINDFGMSRILNEFQSDIQMSTAQGTMRYMPPEVHNASKLSRKADIYSFGVLCVHILTHKFPSPLYASTVDQSGCHVVVSEFKRYQHCLMDLSNSERSFDSMIEHCLQYKASERPGTAELTSSLQNIQRKMRSNDKAFNMQLVPTTQTSALVQQFFGTVVSGCTMSDTTLNLSSFANVLSPVDTGEPILREPDNALISCNDNNLFKCDSSN